MKWNEIANEISVVAILQKVKKQENVIKRSMYIYT